MMMMMMNDCVQVTIYEYSSEKYFQLVSPATTYETLHLAIWNHCGQIDGTPAGCAISMTRHLVYLSRVNLAACQRSVVI